MALPSLNVPSQCRSTSYTDKVRYPPSSPQNLTNAPQFDDLTNVVAGLVPAIQPLGTYGTLTFQGFIWFSGSLGSLLLPPPSAPNAISTGVASQTLYGSAALLPGPSTSAFSLKSIYYACGVNTEASTGALTACMIQFSDVKAAGGETAVWGLVFDPALLINEYNKTEFADTFSGLGRVDVTGYGYCEHGDA